MNASAKPGALFITFEGIEGTGKTTQVELLCDKLRAAGLEVILTCEPGGTALGRDLRSVLLRPDDEPMAPLTELLLYAADRTQHLCEVIEPALDRGAIVLCDRYLDATLAYQGYGRGLDVAMILELHQYHPLTRRPARTLLYDLEPALAIERARRRNADQEISELEGRFEMERLNFHRKVRAGYLTLAAAEPTRIKIIDGSGSIAAVQSRTCAELHDLLPVLKA